jgi:hypothetical protein
MTAIVPSLAGTASTGTAVAASDTIAQSIMGPNGATLEIINASASTDNITISDSGLTPAGNALNLAPGGVYAASVAAGASKVFDLSNAQINPATGLITITHSQVPTVTYKLYPVG